MSHVKIVWHTCAPFSKDSYLGVQTLIKKDLDLPMDFTDLRVLNFEEKWHSLGAIRIGCEGSGLTFVRFGGVDWVTIMGLNSSCRQKPV